MNSNITPKVTSEEAEALLRQWLGSRVVDLRVVIREGGVTLQGTAHSYYAKQLAQHSAMQIFRLPVLANEIVVQFKPCPLDSYGLDLE